MSKINYPDVPDKDWDPKTRVVITRSGKRWVGIFETKKGIASFISSRMSSIPNNALYFEEVDYKEARTKATEILDQYKSSISKLVETNKLEPGSVVAHSDGQKVHLGVVLRIKDEQAFMVMSTTNPVWSKQSRPMTNEEKIMLGVKKDSYFVPVIREVHDLSLLGRYFPQHRVQELLNEFKFT